MTPAPAIVGRVDAPSAEKAIEPLDFYVSGWAWVQGARRVRAIQVWCDSVQLGRSEQLFERPDVSTSLGLPGNVHTGFVVTCHHLGALSKEKTFEISVRVELDNGNVEPMPGAEKIRVSTLPLEQSPMGALRARTERGALGLEIGAHETPVTGVTPYQTDIDRTYAGIQRRLDFLSDAQALPVPTESLDFLCSSHVLEHLPDPLGALAEWHRVLRQGGLLYLVVPDMRRTFDHSRAVTPVQHLLKDFLHARTAAGSLEHIREFVFETDWALLQPGCDPADEAANKRKAYEETMRDARAGNAIGIHYHTFTPASLRAALAAARFIESEDARFEVLSTAENYPSSREDGIALLLRKKGEAARATPATFCLRADASMPPLPLVCPVTLESLHPDGRATPGLATKRGKFTYAIEDECPVLLPKGAKPVRSWSRPWARLLDYAKSRRHMRSAPSPQLPATSAPVTGR